MSDFDSDNMASNYLHWYGVATFLRCPYQPDLKDTDIGLVGVPFGGGNPIEHLQYLGPRTIRNRSAGYRRTHREFMINPFELLRIRDLGDVPIDNSLNPDRAAEDFQAFFEKVFSAGITPVSIGGDHSITWPILRAARKTTFSEPVAMIHFDSHTDAIPAFTSTRNHAGGFRMGAEDGIIDPKRTVQIGMRGSFGSPGMDDWAEENFARVITTEEFVKIGADAVLKQVREVIGDKPAYLSFDLDVLDPAYAPGVADPEVNGLTAREIFQVVQGFRGLNLLGADVVCYCPTLDNPSQSTALIASQLLLDYVSLIADYKQLKA